MVIIVLVDVSANLELMNRDAKLQNKTEYVQKSCVKGLAIVSGTREQLDF